MVLYFNFFVRAFVKYDQTSDILENRDVKVHPAPPFQITSLVSSISWAPLGGQEKVFLNLNIGTNDGNKYVHKYMRCLCDMCKYLYAFIFFNVCVRKIIKNKIPMGLMVCS